MWYYEWHFKEADVLLVEVLAAAAQQARLL